MADHDLRGVNVAAVVADMFEQKEYTAPKQALKEAGATVILVARERGQVQAAHHHDKAEFFEADLSMAEASPYDFDAVLLPGGTFSADQLRMDEYARRFIRDIDGIGKPIAVICHAAWLLVSSGLVQGRTLTSHPSLKDDIENAGGHWDNAEVIADRNWVSSRKPDDIPSFNRAMLAVIAEHNFAGVQ